MENGCGELKNLYKLLMINRLSMVVNYVFMLLFVEVYKPQLLNINFNLLLMKGREKFCVFRNIHTH